MEADEERYARVCRLLVEGAPVALRGIFNGVHPPLFLATSLLKPQTLILLKRMRSYGVLSDVQWRMLFPPNGLRPTSTAFDAQLLTTLLKFVCSLPAPYPGGWTGIPATADRSMAADVVRLQLFRTLLASRQEPRLNEDEFATYWRQIEEVLERLGGRGSSKTPRDVDAGTEHIKQLKVRCTASCSLVPHVLLYCRTGTAKLKKPRRQRLT
jgi:hypothetical protein